MNGPDILTLDLYESLKQPGCPICNAGVIAERRYMGFFLREYVNDVQARIKLQNSWGFCNLHAWQLQELELYESNDGLGNAILYEWMVARTIISTKKVKQQLMQNLKTAYFNFKSKPADVTETFRKTQECPVCSVSINSKSFHLETLVQKLAEDEFIKRYNASDGLCLQHFIQALDLPVDRNLLQILCDLQISRMSNILNNLNSYIGKHDYQNKEAYTADEEAALIKAVSLMAGNKRI